MRAKCLHFYLGGNLVGLNELAQQFFQGTNQARHAFGEFSSVEKQYPTRYRNLPDDMPNGCNTIVQRGLWIAERESAIVTDYRPVLHLVAAEHGANDIFDMHNEDSLCRQQQVVNLNFTVIGIWNHKAVDAFEGDCLHHVR